MKKICFSLLMVCLWAMTVNARDKGDIRGMYFTYTNSSTVSVQPGWCEANGRDWDLPGISNYPLANIPNGEGFVYVYVDHTNSVAITNLVFCNSTNEPVYSGAKLGWYDAASTSNRCIGVVWTTGGAIADFHGYPNNAYLYSGLGIVSPLFNSTNGTGWSNYQVFDAESYIPKNAIKVRVFGSCYTPEYSSQQIIIESYDNNGSAVYTGGTPTCQIFDDIEFSRNGTRKIRYWADDYLEYANNVTIQISGYTVDR